MNRFATLQEEIRRLWRGIQQRLGRPVQLMEICGTHTVAISRGGLRDLLPAGCPVCVTDQSYVDQAVDLARRGPDVVVATYGDMVRVPGRLGSLERARSEGAKVEVVYAAHEAVELARRQAGKQVVFLAVGFETTAPATALALRQAARDGARNFSVFTAHKAILPAMRALLAQPDVRIDGFLCPGHVSVVIGWEAYQPIVGEHRRPCVVAGFEDEQIFAGIGEILRQLAEDAPAACSVYPPVAAEGNPHARKAIEEVFQLADARWRALGVIPASGLVLKDEFAEFDAARRFELPEIDSYELPGCRCGDVICGRCLPTDCSLFAVKCTPRDPIGPCMVSSEGACAASFKYQRHGSKSVKG
jgi:hydrogenase expression/formation protein HypD